MSDQPRPPRATPAYSRYCDVALCTLQDRFAEWTGAVIARRLGPERAILTLRQVELYSREAVEWRVITDTRLASSPIMAYRAQLDDESTQKRFAAAFQADRKAAAIEPVLHWWECRVAESMLTWAMKRLRHITVPLSPGVSPSPPFLLPICTLEAGHVWSALQAAAVFRWQNPRKGGWDELIEFFHTFWYRLECALDGRRPAARAPIPPRGGFNAVFGENRSGERYPLNRPKPGRGRRVGR